MKTCLNRSRGLGAAALFMAIAAAGCASTVGTEDVGASRANLEAEQVDNVVDGGDPGSDAGVAPSDPGQDAGSLGGDGGGPPPDPADDAGAPAADADADADDGGEPTTADAGQDPVVDAGTPTPDSGVAPSDPGGDAGAPPCVPAAVQSYPTATTCCAGYLDDAGAPVWGSCNVTYDGDDQTAGYTVSFACFASPTGSPVPGNIDNGSGTTCSAKPNFTMMITNCYGCNTVQ